jgi:hypothetical protein
MNREKYPNYFLFAFLAYSLAFIFWFGYFFVPASGFGFAYYDFYLISAFLFLPIPLFALYSKSSRFRVLWGKENILRYIITALTIIDVLFALYMSLWLL